MKYTQIPVDTFKNIQLNAGILVDDFNPATGEIGNLLGATTGGSNFTVSNEYSDYGEDIDNCPRNTLELKKLDNIEATLGGTFVTISASTAKALVGAADIDGNNASHVIPRRDLVASDFKDLWWVGDYSDDNEGEDAGFVAIHMMNTLSTGGFQIQSNDRGKGNFAFTFTAHFSMKNQNLVPYEIFIVEGGQASTFYGVKQILTNVASSYTDTSIESGESLEVTLTADEDYEINAVIVTMGGEVLAEAYDETTSKVTIASVTGNVTIVATAVDAGA